MHFLANHGTNLLCHNNFGGKMIIFQKKKQIKEISNWYTKNTKKILELLFKYNGREVAL